MSEEKWAEAIAELVKLLWCFIGLSGVATVGMVYLMWRENNRHWDLAERVRKEIDGPMHNHLDLRADTSRCKVSR